MWCGSCRRHGRWRWGGIEARGMVAGVQPGTWVTLLSGHIGNSPLLARSPVDQGPLGSGGAESGE
jgi:hypothetical protein